MNNVMQPGEHEEIDLILPWYVNGTLDADEQQRVVAHLESCPNCRASLALLSDVQAAVTTNKTIPMIPRPRINDLLDSVGAEHQPRRAAAINYLVAAAIVMALATSLIVVNPRLQSEVPTRYETATSGQYVTAMDYVLDVRFEPGITDSARQALFRDIGAREITDSDARGSYRFVVQVPVNSLEALKGYTDSLEMRPEVASVEVIALQLPMKSKP